MIPFVDAHAHWSGEKELDARRNTFTLMCGTSVTEMQTILRHTSERIIPCCAVHPWYAAGTSFEQMLPFMELCPIVAETGLDSVWTDCPLDVQRTAFEQQLTYAQRANKPVVLHTKGKELEVAQALMSFTMKKLVHWYSCPDGLSDYIAMNCYFTVGPDYATNPAVQALIRRVPLERLLTETDGLDAVSWALGREVSPGDIEGVLAGELNAIADQKGLSFNESKVAVYENLTHFLSCD